MPDSCANALRPTPGQAGGSGCPNAYAAHSPNLRAQDRSTGSPIAAESLIPNPYRNARMQDSRSALPARSPIPFTHVLIQASCPASRSPSAPDTEFATAMPRSLWQCVSTGMPMAEASLANRSLIRPGESPPMVSQYRTRDAPASLAASANSSRYPSSVRDPSSALTPTVSAPPARATATDAVISSMIAERSSLPRNLCAIIWSEVEMDRL